MGTRWVLMLHLRHVVGDYDRGDGPPRLRDADGAVDQVRRLRRDHADVDVLVRHVLVEAYEVHLLLEVTPEAHSLLLADDRDHGLVVELGVVETVEEMYRTRS